VKVNSPCAKLFLISIVSLMSFFNFLRFISFVNSGFSSSRRFRKSSHFLLNVKYSFSNTKSFIRFSVLSFFRKSSEQIASVSCISMFVALEMICPLMAFRSIVSVRTSLNLSTSSLEYPFDLSCSFSV